MKYPKYHTENPDGAQFCGLGGQSLKTKLTYPQCGHVNPKDFKFCNKCGHALIESAPETPLTSPIPTSFTGGRYRVKKFLGEGCRKKVYLAHDTLLDREVTFALIKTEKELFITFNHGRGH